MKDKGGYRNEVDKPKKPKQGHMMSGMGADDFKAQAADQAYGQQGKKGCESDHKKIASQFNHSVYSDNSGY